MEGDKTLRFEEMRTHLSKYSELSSLSVNEVPVENLVLFFYQLMADEFSYRQEHGLDVLPLRMYYKNLFVRDNLLIPASAKGNSLRLIPAIEECRKLKGMGRILDAGSGYGTESLLFSLLGNEVTGVELVPERILVAESRIGYFASEWDAPLRLQFVNADIFRYLEKAEPFDIIWVMEAISHIHPPDVFLDLVGHKLKKGGKIIISDPNGLSPLAWLRSVKIRGSIKHKTHKRFKDPETGKPIEYGQERIFSVYGLKKMLIEKGFKVNRISISGFMGTSFTPNFLLLKKPVVRFLGSFERNIRKIPLISSFGSVFTIVACKEE
jgi:SAM-dependent methyltransferase